MRFAVPYYRVSTKRQGRSHLGLDAQQHAVRGYCTANGYTILQEIAEVKSTRKTRPKLLEALELCRKHHATLVVARLDRVGRDVIEIATIIKSSVEVVVTDSPNANRFTIHVLAAVAEENRRIISENTKLALDAAKRKGTLLGKHGKTLSQKNKQAADEFAKLLKPVVEALGAEGYTSVRALAGEFNRRKVPTFREGARWHVASVYNLLNRMETICSNEPMVA